MRCKVLDPDHSSARSPLAQLARSLQRSLQHLAVQRLRYPCNAYHAAMSRASILARRAAECHDCKVAAARCRTRSLANTLSLACVLLQCLTWRFDGRCGATQLNDAAGKAAAAAPASPSGPLAAAAATTSGGTSGNTSSAMGPPPAERGVRGVKKSASEDVDTPSDSEEEEEDEPSDDGEGGGATRRRRPRRCTRFGTGGQPPKVDACAGAFAKHIVTLCLLVLLRVLAEMYALCPFFAVAPGTLTEDISAVVSLSWAHGV